MNGTVSLRSVHGKYLSAQPDGRAEWNRTIAAEWEYFQVEQRHNGKITLKSAHGTYVSAQPDGSVQINRREAPPGGWEVFTVEDRGNKCSLFEVLSWEVPECAAKWHSTMEPRPCAKRRLGRHPVRAAGRYRPTTTCNKYSIDALVCNRRSSRKLGSERELRVRAW